MRALAGIILVMGLCGGLALGQDGAAPAEGNRDKSVVLSSEFQAPEGTVSGLIYAVIVGIDYKNSPDIPPLESAESDAHKLYDTLVSVTGGRVSAERTRILTDDTNPPATRDNILGAIEDFAGVANPLDTILVYFSGHGVEYKDKNYLIPAGITKEQIKVQGLKLTDVMEFMGDTKASQKIALIDACHSAAASLSGDELVAGKMTADFMNGLTQVNRGWAIVSSCDVDQTSVESPDIGGVFTYYLCKGLDGEANFYGDPFITLDEVYKYVFDNVTDWCSHNNAKMSPRRMASVAGDIPLAVVNYQGMPVKIAERVLNQPGEYKVKEVTLDEYQQQTVTEDLLVKAKLLFYGVKDESTLNREYKLDLDEQEVRATNADLERYLAANPDSAEGLHYKALAQIHVAIFDHPSYDDAYRAQLKEKALPLVEQAVALDPLNPEQHQLLAEIYLALDDYPNCYAAAQQVLNLDPQAEYGYVYGGASLLMQGRLAEALKVLGDGIQHAPENPHLYKLTADCYGARGQFSKALAALTKAEELYRKVGTGYYGVLALCLSNIGDYSAYTDPVRSREAYAQALQVMQDHAADQTGNPVYYSTSAILSYSLGRVAEFRSGVMKAYAMAPDNLAVLLARGMYYREAGNDILAEKDERAALALKPENPVAWVELASTLDKRGDRPGMLNVLDKVVELQPESWNRRIARGVAKLAAGDTAGAQADFDYVLQQAPGDPDILNLVGVAYGNTGNYAKAIEYYLKAQALLDAPIYRANLVQCYLNLGQFDQAHAQMDVLLKANPGNAYYLDLAGQLARAEGNVAQAREYFTQAAAQKSNFNHQNDLAFLLASTGDPGADEAYNQMVADYSDNITVYNLRGLHLMNEGRYVAAVQDLQKVVEEVPEFIPATLNLVMCLVQAGESASAEDLLRQSIRDYSHPSYYISLITLLLVDPARKDEAQQLKDELKRLYPDHPLTLSAEAYWQSNGGDSAQAGQVLGAAAEQFPDQAVYQLELGHLSYNRGDYRGALPYYEQAAKLDPASADAHEALGRCLAKLGRLADARAELTRALELDAQPERYEPLLEVLALDPAWAKDYDAALAKLLADYADHPFTLLYNGGRLLIAGSGPAALEVFRRGTQLYPQDARFPAREGDCLAALGQPAEAAARYRVALKLNYTPEVVGQLARALAAAGDPAAADEVWRSFLRDYPGDTLLRQDQVFFCASAAGWTRRSPLVTA